MKDIATIFVGIAVAIILWIAVGQIAYNTGKYDATQAIEKPNTSQPDHFRDITKKVSLDHIIDAIAIVESNGNPLAIGDGGNAVGAFQIHKVFVDDVNRILELNTDYFNYEDRKSYGLSRTMVEIWFSYYSKRWTMERCIRWYNAGGNWKGSAAQRYYDKVMAVAKGE